MYIMKKVVKRIACILLGLMLLAAVGCAKSTAESVNYDKQMAPMEEPAMAEGDFGFSNDAARGADEAESAAGAPAPNPESHDYGNKIIKNAYMEMETYEFDKTIQAMQDLLAGMGGYVESSNISGQSLQDGGYVRRSAHFEFRVPAESYQAFLNSVGDLGNVTNKSEGGQDISYQYYDTEAHLESLQIQEDRLLAILEKADKLEDVITLEQALGDVRYQIESLQGQLRRWDNLVSFSRVSVNITEVKEYTEVTEEPDTLWQRIGDTLRRSVKALGNFLEAMLVGLTAVLPFLLLFAVIALVIILIVRASSRRRASRREEKEKSKENQE
jgi:uncharacterized membrane protein